MRFVSCNKQIVVSRVGDLSLFVAAATIDDADWNDWVERGGPIVTAAGAPRFVLNYSTGTGPNAKQRALLAERKEQFGFDHLERQVLLTDSLLLRGAITAMSWIMRTKVEARAFKTSDLEKSIEWLAEKARFDQAEARKELAEMSALVGLPVPGSMR